MYNYSIHEWIAFFIIYCFVGWIIESVYVSFEYGRWVNRGFLNGPFLPIYGFGAIIILISTLFVRENVFFVFLFGMTGTTLLEYITGYLLEKIFHAKYWDYTYDFFNINGYVCLFCSLCWGLLSIFLVNVLHTPVEHFVGKTEEKILVIADVTFLIYFVTDIVVSAKQAFDLKKIIDEKIKQNEYVLRMQKRIDVVIALLNDDKERVQQRVDAFKEEIAGKRREIEMAIEEYNQKLDEYTKNAFKILKRNPGFAVPRDKSIIEDIKSFVRSKHEKR